MVLVGYLVAGKRDFSGVHNGERCVSSGLSSACVRPVGASVRSNDRASACDIKCFVS